MAGDVDVRESKPKAHEESAADSQTSLGTKLEDLGHGITDAWQSVSAAVTEVEGNVEGALGSTFEAVKGAAASVGETVEGAASAVGRAFDIPEHVRRHPWPLMAAAVFLGFLAGRMLGGRR